MARDGLKGVMSDLAETIRRAFQAPPSRAPNLAFQDPACGGIPPMAAQAVTPPARFQPVPHPEPCGFASAPVAAPMAWAPRVLGEPGWAAWATGAVVCQLPLFEPERAQRLEVPALPSRAAVRRQPVEPLAARGRRSWDGFQAPPVRSLRPACPTPKVSGALEQILALPVAVTGEDLQKISKALWMRYTLQLVRSTGQNIRNLEVLGLYLIPAKGTRQVRHDPSTGRLLVTLGPEAIHAKRAPFVLARQKDDHAVVCCFVEAT